MKLNIYPYVIIGAHIDSWTKGAVDSGTGYSVIWELARGFGALINGGKYLVSLDTVEIAFGNRCYCSDKNLLNHCQNS
jgi:hypothetical protein